MFILDRCYHSWAVKTPAKNMDAIESIILNYSFAKFSVTENQQTEL